MSKGEVFDNLTDEEQNVFRQQAISALQRSQHKPIEQEDWAEKYIDLMAKEVFYERELINDWYTSEREKTIEKQPAQGFMGRMWGGVTNYFTGNEVGLLNAEFERKKGEIDEKEIVIRARYQLKSRSLEATKLAEEYLKTLPGIGILSEEERNGYLKKTRAIKNNQLDSEEKGTQDYDENADKTLHQDITIYIRNKFLKESEKDIQNELQTIDGLNDIDPEIRLGLIEAFRNSYITKAMLEKNDPTLDSAESDAARLNKAKTDLAEQRQKIEATVYCLYAEDYQNLSEDDQLKRINYITERYKVWHKKARDKFSKILGSDTLPNEEKKNFLQEMIKIEEKYSLYDESINNADFFQKYVVSAFHTRVGDNPFGRIVAQEEALKKEVQDLLPDFYPKKQTTPSKIPADHQGSKPQKNKNNAKSKSKAQKLKAKQQKDASKNKSEQAKIIISNEIPASPESSVVEARSSLLKPASPVVQARPASPKHEPIPEPVAVQARPASPKQEPVPEPVAVQARPASPKQEPIPEPKPLAVQARPTSPIPEPLVVHLRPVSPKQEPEPLSLQARPASPKPIPEPKAIHSMATSSESEPRVMQTMSDQDEQWHKIALEKFSKISGSDRLSEEAKKTYIERMIQIEKQFTEYTDSRSNAGFMGKIFNAVLETETGDNPKGRIFLQERQLKKEIENAVKKTYPIEIKKIVEKPLPSLAAKNKLQGSLTKAQKVSAPVQAVQHEKPKIMPLPPVIHVEKAKVEKTEQPKSLIQAEKPNIEQAKSIRDFEPKFQAELLTIKDLNQIDPELRLGLIAEYRNSYISMANLEENHFNLNGPGAEANLSLNQAKTEVALKRQKLVATIFCVKSETYANLSESEKQATLDYVQKNYGVWAQTAQEKFTRISGSDTLPQATKVAFIEKMVHIEEQFTNYHDSVKRAGFLAQAAAAFDTEYGDNPYGRICAQERKNLQAIKDLLPEIYPKKVVQQPEPQALLSPAENDVEPGETLAASETISMTPAARSPNGAVVPKESASDKQSVLERAALDPKMQTAKPQEEWIQKAHKKLSQIPGNEKLSPEKRDFYITKMTSIEEQFASYHAELQNAGILALAAAAFHTEYGDNPYGRICAQERQIRKEIENEALPAVYKTKVDVALKEQLDTFNDLDKLQPALRESFENDLKGAILNQEMIKDGLLGNAYIPDPKYIRREIRIALEFVNIPSFHNAKNIGGLRTLLGTLAKDVAELRKIRKNMPKQNVQELIKAKSTEKLLIDSIKTNVTKLTEHDFTEKDNKFKVDKGQISYIVQQTKDTISAYFKRPEIQAAFAMANLVGGTAGTLVPFYGTVSGALIGAIIGYQKPATHKILAPFKFLFNEISDIFSKPRSYIDRAFRASIILGILVAAVYVLALAAFAIGITNPFTASAILGVAAIGLVAAGAAKVAKWISTKVSEQIYGIANSDRYELSNAAKMFFKDALAHKIRKFFIHEIRQTQKKIEGLSDNSSPEAYVLSKKLYELEATWDKIQLGNEESLKAWGICSKDLYLSKRDEYQINVKNEIEEHKEDIVNVLLDISKPKNSLKEDDKPMQVNVQAIDKKVETKQKPAKKKLLFSTNGDINSDNAPIITNEPSNKSTPKKEKLAFLYHDNKNTEKPMKEILEIELLNREIEALTRTPSRKD